ncbi:DUF2953 domain-containing protein [Bacillus sp. PS06]|uniref:DUF2953 domain-containing protein n=1 Tax=Bacillus sp. PS06 TaxID=2764176 RepID=UPI00177CDD6F|nr:DUF2953 domain-containing protein [Bacillus sp. PS06]MBD8068980.1 DUF2953 domain-containing protein [Bacillus sp. PS06]
MKWVLIIFLIIIALLFILLISKLKVLILFNHSPKNEDIKIKFSLWFGLIRYTIHIPQIKVDDDSPNIELKHEEKSNLKEKKTKDKKKKFTPDEIIRAIQDSGTILDHVANFHKIIKKFLHSVTVTKVNWHTAFGIGDAAQTGIFVGLGWSVKGVLLGIISQYMNLKAKPNISITPLFQQLYSETKFECMFHFRVGKAMLAGIRLVRYWKGNLPKFKSAPLSMLTGSNSKITKS